MLWQLCMQAAQLEHERSGVIARTAGGCKYACSRILCLSTNTTLCSDLNTSFSYHLMPLLMYTGMHCKLDSPTVSCYLSAIVQYEYSTKNSVIVLLTVGNTECSALFNSL
jgi:hypothetical protein